jgi:hypothetical protein
MRPENLLYWLRAVPFRPFRLVLVDGKTYEVRHPDFVRLMRTSLVVFEPSAEEQVYERGQMVGLGLISRIEPMEATATA